MRKYFTGGIIVIIIFIAYFGYADIIISSINLSTLADISQIIIATGAVLSIVFAVKTIRESNWSLAMAHVPSIAIQPGRILTLVDSVAGNFHNITNPGDVPQKIKTDETLAIKINFSCQNLGRGTAFNIKQPIVVGAVYQGQEWKPTPLYMTARIIDEDYFEFNILIEKSFDDWIANGNNKLPVRIEVKYTNDQKNVQCCSWWKAEILPFDVADVNLTVRDLRVLSREAGVDYSPIK